MNISSAQDLSLYVEKGLETKTEHSREYVDNLFKVK